MPGRGGGRSFAAMQHAMLRLDAVLRRHRRLVLGAWIVVLLAALPFAARQSEHLSSGGFGVPGSQSAAVEAAMERIPGAQGAQLAAVLIPARGATDAQLSAAVDRVAAAAGPVAGVSLPDAARERAVAQARAGGVLVVPLRAEVGEDDGDRGGGRPARAPRGRRGRTRGREHPSRGAGRAVGGHAGAEQGGPRQGGVRGLPDRAAHPARRLRLAGRRGAAARARLRRGDGHRGADLPALAGDGDVGLRDQHGLDDRHRRGRRLLAVHRRPLPRGAGRRPPPRRGPRRRDGDLRPRRALLRRHRDRVPGRAVDGRQHGDPLDGAGGDARGRGRDARLGHAPAAAAGPARGGSLAVPAPAPARRRRARASGAAGPTP